MIVLHGARLRTPKDSRENDESRRCINKELSTQELRFKSQKLQIRTNTAIAKTVSTFHFESWVLLPFSNITFAIASEVKALGISIPSERDAANALS